MLTVARSTVESVDTVMCELYDVLHHNHTLDSYFNSNLRSGDMQWAKEIGRLTNDLSFELFAAKRASFDTPELPGGTFCDIIDAIKGCRTIVPRIKLCFIWIRGVRKFMEDPSLARRCVLVPTSPHCGLSPVWLPQQSGLETVGA